MNRLGFFFNYALNHLKHGGQRALIAILAVAFGVMSLITMVSVSNAISRTVVTDARVQLGGDLRITHPERNFTLADFAQLDELQASGDITGYSPVRQQYTVLIRTVENGHANMIDYAIGIDPQTYPIAGDLTINAPEGESLANLLREKNSVVITRDVAQQTGLEIGDTITIAQYDGTVMPEPLQITGIIGITPNHMGQRIYFNLETAVAIAKRPDAFQYALVSTETIDNTAEQLSGQNWEIAKLDPNAVISDPSGDFFVMMLRGAGVLGLIVGGIGIANTMQVLLAQRRQEVAILKTLGISQRAMIFVFLMEVGMMGLFGGVIGAVVAVGASQLVVQSFSNMGNMLISWEFEPLLIIGGVLISVISSVLFALYAIFRSSNVRPTAIFRQDTPESGGWMASLQALGFYTLLAIPFAGITTLIMGSVVEGVGVLLVALGGLIVFSILLGGLTWLILWVMPTFRNNLLRMARNNMRKRIMALMFAMIALFIGIFTIGFAVAIIQIGTEQFTARQDTAETHNLLVYTDNETVPAVEQMLRDHGVNLMNKVYTAKVASAALENEINPAETVYIRETAWDIEISEGPAFGSVLEGVYLPYPSDDHFIIEMQDGTRHVLPVIGEYTLTDENVFTNNRLSPVISLATAEHLGLTPQTVNLYARVEGDESTTLAQNIGQQFPQAMTLTRQAVVDQLNNAFTNILVFAVIMAGLSIVAGLMLVANVVSLAMIERRKEIGVMKAVGYTQQHILTLFGMEYGLIGLSASLIGVLGVQVVMIILGMTSGVAATYLTMSLPTAGLILVIGVVLTLVIALLSAWRPSGIRPLLILNEQGG